MRLTANQKVWIVLVILVIMSFTVGVFVGLYIHEQTEWQVIAGEE